MTENHDFICKVIKTQMTLIFSFKSSVLGLSHWVSPYYRAFPQFSTYFYRSFLALIK